MRHDEMSQGDIYDDVPIWLPPTDALEPWDLTAGSVMVLTPSCLIDKQPEADRLILVAPVVTLEDRALSAADLSTIRRDDCVHHYMYLPEEGDFPEQIVEFLRAQPIRYGLLRVCDRLTQLTAAANRQLLRKLTIYFTSGHFPIDQFELREDDFPGGVA